MIPSSVVEDAAVDPEIFALVDLAVPAETASGTARWFAGHAAGIRWLASELTRMGRGRVVVAAVLQVVSTVVFVAVSAMILVFARAIGSAENATMFGVPLGHARDWSGRAAFLVVFLSCVLLAAWTHFAAEKLASSIAMSHGSSLRLDLVGALSCASPEQMQTFAGTNDGAATQPAGMLYRSVIGHVREIEVATRHLILMAGPATLFVVSATILLITSAVLAAMLVPVAVIFLLLLRRQTRAVRSVTGRLLEADAALKTQFAGNDLSALSIEWQRIVDDAAIGDRFAHRRLLAPTGTRSIAHIATGVAAAILVVGGVSLGLEISVLVPCILATRFLMQAVEGMSARVVGIARRAGSIESHLASLAAFGLDASAPRQLSTRRSIGHGSAESKVQAQASESLVGGGVESEFRFSLGVGDDAEHLEVSSPGKVLVLCTGAPNRASRLRAVLAAVAQTAGANDGGRGPRIFLSRVRTATASMGEASPRPVQHDGGVCVVVNQSPLSIGDPFPGTLTFAVTNLSYRWTNESLSELGELFDGVMVVGPDRVVGLGDIEWFRDNHVQVRQLLAPRQE